MIGESRKTAKDVCRCFDRIASVYDFLNVILSFGLDYHWRKCVVKELLTFDSCQILDVCCGTGEIGRLIEKFGSNCRPRVYGCDFSLEMLHHALKKNKKQRWIRSDALNLSFKDSSFDVVSVAFGIRNVIDRGRALRELWRVCKVGGRVVILEFTSGDVFWMFRPFYMVYLRYFLPWIGTKISMDSSAYRYLSASVNAFPCSEDFESEIRREIPMKTQSMKIRKLSFGVAVIFILDKK